MGRINMEKFMYNSINDKILSLEFNDVYYNPNFKDEELKSFLLLKLMNL